MKVVKKVLLISVTVLLVLMVSFNIYNLFSLKIMKRPLTTIGGYSVLEVVSGSMEPAIHIGDMIIINTKESSYSENDIVTFLDVNGSFVTHRIVKINEEEMITKGDFNNTEDEPTKIDKIVGKYVTKIPGAGKLLSSLKNPFTLVMILIIGLLVCYLISTDKNGNPIFTEEEKEFWGYKKKKQKTSKQKKKFKKKDKILSEKESIEKEIEALFKEKREINKKIRALLEKKESLKKKKYNSNYHHHGNRNYNNKKKNQTFQKNNNNQKNNRKNKSGE